MDFWLQPERWRVKDFPGLGGMPPDRAVFGLMLQDE